MDRGEAVSRVATNLHGHLWASSPDELVAEYDSLSEADQERVNSAIEEVALRLARMGKGARS